MYAGAGQCRDLAGNMLPYYLKSGGGKHNPTWCRAQCSALDACAGWTYWAEAGDCWVFGLELQADQAPEKWSHGTGTGGRGVLGTTTGTLGYACYIKGAKGAFCSA